MSVAQNANVKDRSTSDGAIQPFPSWAPRVEICGKIFSLMKVPWLNQFHIQADDFYSLSNSEIYFPSFVEVLLLLFLKPCLLDLLRETQKFFAFEPSGMPVVYENATSQN